MNSPAPTANPIDHELEDLDYEEFSQLVEDDIRGRAKESGSAWLRNPNNLIDWLRELGFVRRSVESSIHFIATEKREHPANPSNFDGNQQLADAAGWQEALDLLRSRQTRAMKFLSYVQARIKEAAYLISKTGVARHNEADLLMSLHKIENLLIDKEADGALTILSALLDEFSEEPQTEL